MDFGFLVFLILEITASCIVNGILSSSEKALLKIYKQPKKFDTFVSMKYGHWLIVICTFALSMNSFGQDSNYCMLVDSVSREPVAYASISAGSFYIHSDERGRFPVNDIPRDTFNIT